MKPSWFFREMSRGEVNVDPIQREFFTTEAIDGAVEALVRESIQNSLDAGRHAAKVQVRIVLSKGANAVTALNAARYFNDLWPHLEAKKNGLPTPPGQSDAVPFLVIEDFGTSGLRGDPEQEQDRDGSSARNDFYYFWRNVGRSGKEEKDRGRWGLGKTVFPASSRINTFFGLTVRDDDRTRLLMGQSVLKVHNIGKSRCYPYGYFGQTNAEDEFVLPISAAREIDEFCECFSLVRGTQPGLSIVVPFPQEDVSTAVLIRAVVRQYYFAILSGSLEVSIHEGDREVQLKAEQLKEVIDQQDEAIRKELLPLVELASWACKEGKDQPFLFPAPPQDQAPKWSDIQIQEERLVPLRVRFEKGERLAFRFPLHITPEGGNASQTSFDIFVKRDLALDSHRPQFIREGIIVSDAYRLRVSALYALVVIEDKPIATLLGDAENPAHTEWQERSAHFRDRYRYGPSILRFIKNSVAELVKRLTRSEGEVDPKALVDVFFLPKPPEPDQIPAPSFDKPKPGPEPDEEHPPIPRREQRFQVVRAKGGFSVLPRNGVAPPEKIAVTVAYGVRKGNAFRRYQKADFELDKDPIAIIAEGATVEVTGNSMGISAISPDFRVGVTGFDQERDLQVRAMAQGASDDSQI